MWKVVVFLTNEMITDLNQKNLNPRFNKFHEFTPNH